MKAGDNRGDPADLLAELQQNTSDAVLRTRAHERIRVRASVVVQPGNASDQQRFKAQGVTGDISSGGCQILSPLPMVPGDFYRLSFDRQVVDLGLTFARCLRCKLIREDAFEVGFAFFTALDLTTAIRARAA